MLSDGNRQRSAFLGIGSGTKFVEQHQRIRGCSARDEIDIRDVRGERRKVLLDRLIVANIGENGVENRHVGAIRGNGNAGLGHQSKQAERFQGNGFAAGVRSGDHQLAALAFKLDGDRDNLGVLEFQVALKQRMPCAMENEPGFARLGRPRAAVPT